MGKFVIKEGKGFSFKLLASNGQAICNGQSYSTIGACKKGIASVQANCAAPVEDQTKEGYTPVTNPKFEVYVDKAGEFRFRLKARNGQIIATGEGYKTIKNCLNGIASIGKNAPEAPVVIEEK